jgi:hypothetical protein
VSTLPINPADVATRNATEAPFVLPLFSGTHASDAPYYSSALRPELLRRASHAIDSVWLT